ncbi:hypothetical protein GA0111570_102267 [Raineyella antarctica]|uniref:HNH endonuclease n=1 Tax=Raineyella antarctica TaxID=1577474 RepID=A0A1G6GER7_9ACTN|nr:hypothetical protein GA0111570_102267 [Raineyella antarctica]
MAARPVLNARLPGGTTFDPKTAAAVALAVMALAGCTASPNGAAPEPSPSTGPTTASSAPAAQRQSSTAGGTRLRSVHTSAIMVDDMKLQLDRCHERTLDAAQGLVLPDRACTPGAIDPAVTQADINQTICKSGYTATVRPSAYVTGKAKTASLAAYGTRPSPTIEYDHLVSLELGGASSTSNLWPEANHAGAKGTTNPKDTVENAIHKAVCSKQVTLSAAQKAIATNWTTAETVLHIIR